MLRMEYPKSQFKFPSICLHRFLFPWCTAQQKQRKTSGLILLLKKHMLHQHKKTQLLTRKARLKRKITLVLSPSFWGHHFLVYGHLLQKNKEGGKSVWHNPLAAHISWRSVAFFLLHSKLGVEEKACSPETVYTSSTQLETQHSLVSAELPGCGSSRCLCSWYIHLKRPSADLENSTLCWLPMFQCTTGFAKTQVERKVLKFSGWL